MTNAKNTLIPKYKHTNVLHATYADWGRIWAGIHNVPHTYEHTIVVLLLLFCMCVYVYVSYAQSCNPKSKNSNKNMPYEYTLTI